MFYMKLHVKVHPLKQITKLCKINNEHYIKSKYFYSLNYAQCSGLKHRINSLNKTWRYKLFLVPSCSDFNCKDASVTSADIYSPVSNSETKEGNEASLNFTSSSAQSDLSHFKINVLEPPGSHEDVEFIAPELKPTFNLAAYADKSNVLKQFINLGVEIAQWEKYKAICFDILRMNFETEIQPYIFFLHDNGVQADKMGVWLTKNPLVFKENLDDLYVRINYLESKTFSKEDISSLVTRMPTWVNYSTVQIDKELGIYQRTFKLSGNEVKDIVLKDPKLILFTMKKALHLQRTCLLLGNELGFSEKEMKQILLRSPRIYRTNEFSLVKRFIVVHNEIGFSLDTISKFPQVLLIRDRILSERHQFLLFLGKNQYNCEKPNYVAPSAFLKTDGEFCVDIGHTSTDLYNDFLKTL